MLRMTNQESKAAKNKALLSEEEQTNPDNRDHSSYNGTPGNLLLEEPVRR
jgi:hypothetical protein